jgi:hypothetical protein
MKRFMIEEFQMMTQSRADAILDVLDEVYNELVENKMVEQAKQVFMLQESITAQLERDANNCNPFVR